MFDQKEHWEILHKKSALDHFSEDPSSFAFEAAELLPPYKKVLELGCGAGNDSNYFAALGHQVIAVDFSSVAIEKNRQNYKADNLKFEVVDISGKLPFKNSSFDLVYARLSLHYFTDKKTKEIFREIERIIKVGGHLCFIVKSTKDPLYGKGEIVEKDMFENNGHIRHFFSEDYVKNLLEDKFETVKLESGEEKFYGDTSSFIKVIARKI